MNHHRPTICLSVISFLVLACLAVAQPDSPPEGKAADTGAKEPKKNGPEGGKEERKDPTKASDKLKELLNMPKEGKGGNVAPKMPVISLRGRVVAKDQPAAALLEVDGKILTVVKGSVFGGPNRMSFLVTELNSREVRIEVSPLKETISLR